MLNSKVPRWSLQLECLKLFVVGSCPEGKGGFQTSCFYLLYHFFSFLYYIKTMIITKSFSWRGALFVCFGLHILIWFWLTMSTSSSSFSFYTYFSFHFISHSTILLRLLCILLVRWSNFCDYPSLFRIKLVRFFLSDDIPGWILLGIEDSTLPRWHDGHFFLIVIINHLQGFRLDCI